MSMCNMMGIVDIGVTHADCCSFLNVAAPQIIAGTDTGVFANEMVCHDSTCLPVMTAAAVMAQDLLGLPAPAQLAAGCDLIPPPPSPAPTSASNVPSECYPFNDNDGNEDTSRSVGVILPTCCDKIKDVVERTTGSSQVKDPKDFGIGDPILCGNNDCVEGVKTFLQLQADEAGDVTSTTVDARKAMFDLECVAVKATPRSEDIPCNPLNSDHSSCFNPYFNSGYSLMDECPMTLEDFVNSGDDGFSSQASCTDRYNYFVELTQSDALVDWSAIPGYVVGDGNRYAACAKPSLNHDKYNNCFHEMVIFALKALKQIKIGDDYWAEDHADYGIKKMHSYGIRYLPFSGECTGVDDKAGRGVSIVANLGCGGSCNSTADSVKALQTVYFQSTAMTLVNQWKDLYGWILSPDDVKDALTEWKKKLVEDVFGHASYTDTEGNEAKIFTAAFVQEAFTWAIASASEGSVGLVFGGYLLMIAYAMFGSMLRLDNFAYKSRFILGFLGVVTVALGIGSGLGIASVYGVKFNATSVQVLPFLLLGLGVDDMFIVASSFQTFSKTVSDDDEISGNCLAVVGPSILLTSVTNIISFLFGMLTPLPVCIAFAQMAAFCVAFIFLNVLFVFTAVCAWDAKRRRRGLPDPLFSPCFKAVDRDTVVNETGAEMGGGKVAQGYANFIVSIPGRVIVMIGLIVFLVLMGTEGWVKLKQGLSFEHIFLEGSHEADFWIIQDGYFGFMPFAIATRKIEDWPKQHPLYFRLQTAVEADDCMDDICLCRSSKNPIACAGYYGNNGIHEKTSAEGVDLGIGIPFPGSVENECRLQYENWVKCITTSYSYVNSQEGQPWIRERYADKTRAFYNTTANNAWDLDVMKESDYDDFCADQRASTFDICKEGWLDFDSLTRGVYALWKDETHPVPLNRVFTQAEVKDYYSSFPYEYPKLSQAQVPQTWIKPYDDLVSKLGLNWLHMMYQWGLPCWYGLPWAYLGGGGPTASGYPVAGTIPDLKSLCKAGFSSEATYNVRCEDGHFGEATDTDNGGKCGAAWGQTWGKHLERVPFEYMGTTTVKKGGSCCTELTNVTERNCNNCDYISPNVRFMLDPKGGNDEWDADTSVWNNLDDSVRQTQYRRGELSATMDILVEYVFDPLGMEVIYDDTTGRALYVLDPRIDTFDDESGRSGNFSIGSITGLLVPNGNGISGANPADQAILDNEMFGECEVPDHGHCPGSIPMVDENGDPVLNPVTGFQMRDEYCKCHEHGGGEALLSRCTAWPVAYMMCDVEGDGWAKTGKEPCWKGQEWLDAYNSAFYTLAFHPHHFEECIKVWVDNDDYWKLLGPSFQCECTKAMEEKDLTKSGLSFSIPEGTCELGPKDDANPSGYHTDCSLIPQGYRKLIYPMPITLMQLFANRLDSTEKYVELIRWSRDTISKYEANTGFPAFPTGIPIIFWEQYTTLWDTVSQVVILMAIVVWAIMAFTFIFIQPSFVPLPMKILTASWTSFILVMCILMITYTLVCLMGVGDIWLNGIPAVTLIVSVGIAVEFTAHLCFAYLQSSGSAADRTRHAIDHMFKPLLDGAISTQLGIIMLSGSIFIFVFKYFFLLYSVLTAGGLVIGLVVLPTLLGMVGLPAINPGGATSSKVYIEG